MEFAHKLAIFAILAATGGWTAARLGAALGGEGRADRFLASGTVFFAQITMAGALLGFTGNIGAEQYLVFYCAAALIVELALRKFAPGGAPVSLIPPKPTFRPLPLGFFLP